MAMTGDQRAAAKAGIRAWARAQAGIRSAEKYVLEQLAFLGDPEAGNTCFPSAPWIAERVNLSERQVRDLLTALEGWGLVAGQRQQGKATVWTLNLGVVVAQAQREPRKRVPRSKALQAVETPAPQGGSPGREFRPTPEAGSGEVPRKFPYPTPEVSSGHPGREFQETPELASDKGKGRDSKGEREGTVPPRDTHTPLAGFGERRRQPRPPTELHFKVLEVAFDAGGNGVESLGTFALTEERLAEWGKQYPQLRDDPATGIAWWLKVAQGKCNDYAESPETWPLLRSRGDLLRWLAEVWLHRENLKLQRKSIGKGQQRITAEVG